MAKSPLSLSKPHQGDDFTRRCIWNTWPMPSTWLLLTVPAPAFRKFGTTGLSELPAKWPKKCLASDWGGRRCERTTKAERQPEGRTGELGHDRRRGGLPKGPAQVPQTGAVPCGSLSTPAPAPHYTQVHAHTQEEESAYVKQATAPRAWDQWATYWGEGQGHWQP